MKDIIKIVLAFVLLGIWLWWFMPKAAGRELYRQQIACEHDAAHGYTVKCGNHHEVRP